MAGGGKTLVKEAISPDALRHKREYDSKYESTPERKKYRAELNQARRLRGIYGHGGPDMSHTKRGTIVEEDPHSNRARHFADRGTLKSEGMYGDDPYGPYGGGNPYDGGPYGGGPYGGGSPLECCTKVKMYMVDALGMSPEYVMPISCDKLQADPRYEKWSELAGCEGRPSWREASPYTPTTEDEVNPYNIQRPSEPVDGYREFPMDWQQKNAGEPIDLAFQLLKFELVKHCKCNPQKKYCKTCGRPAAFKGESEEI